MDHKIYSIIKNKDDIIFLSDIRLNSNNQVSGLHDLEKKFGFYGYTVYHNSRKSSRGVGIVISKKLKHTVVRKIVDREDNFLLLDMEIMGIDLWSKRRRHAFFQEFKKRNKGIKKPKHNHRGGLELYFG